jgi:hypothetical protein
VREQGPRDAPSPARRIHDLLSPRWREVLREEAFLKRLQSGAEPPTPTDLARLKELAAALNRILEHRDFYQEGDFAKTELADEVKATLKQRRDLEDAEMHRLNGRLLSAAFPRAIASSPFPTRTVHVHVTQTEKPVILALTAYSAVRWHVAAAKGVKVTQIICGGYHRQEVVGLDVPVSYHVYEGRKPGDAGRGYFFAYKKDDRYYGETAVAARADGAGDHHVPGPVSVRWPAVRRWAGDATTRPTEGRRDARRWRLRREDCDGAGDAQGQADRPGALCLRVDAVGC